MYFRRRKYLRFEWKCLGFTFNDLVVGVRFHIDFNIYRIADPSRVSKN